MATFCSRAKAQGIAMRTNVAADVLGVPNLGVDFVLNDYSNVSIALLGGKAYLAEPLKKTMLVGSQLEYRYWFSHQPYENFFLGLQFAPVVYKIQLTSEHRGMAMPAGFNFGYSWPINQKMNIEACYGAGFIYYIENNEHKHTFSTTNFGINLTYILK